jgi:hypothetical protein
MSALFKYFVGKVGERRCFQDDLQRFSVPEEVGAGWFYSRTRGGTQTHGREEELAVTSRRVGGYTWWGPHYTPGLFSKEKKKRQSRKTVKPKPQRSPGDERQNW